MSIKQTPEILKPVLRFLVDPSVTRICLNRGSGLGNDDEGHGSNAKPKTPRPCPSPATV